MTVITNYAISICIAAITVQFYPSKYDFLNSIYLILSLIHYCRLLTSSIVIHNWIPACAGMTVITNYAISICIAAITIQFYPRKYDFLNSIYLILSFITAVFQYCYSQLDSRLRGNDNVLFHSLFLATHQV